ncbi:putative quinol monooxygenase [Brenneria izbisi]|uniref:Antibiotic biosynthesis monooxygenase n=1 Tax=Brenneria izbisi TaxID=2939450 RepID=A0AA41XWJ9_9GAMM|nr:putative quinol monooxygenase [Brenneria izbisi]MCV9877727.1 antibiotic biosynthesis monooxygenase [Brenneria izbisi]MCV9880708.1 antibiotic biosynthesis monooxygenase [Brenneria izbisi]
MEIRIVASLQAKAEFLDDVAAAVKRVVEPSRQEPGNLQYDLHEEIDAPGSFVFFERWKSQAILDEHDQSAHFKRLIAELDGKTERMEIKLLKSLG